MTKLRFVTSDHVTVLLELDPDVHASGSGAVPLSITLLLSNFIIFDARKVFSNFAETSGGDYKAANDVVPCA